MFFHLWQSQVWSGFLLLPVFHRRCSTNTRNILYNIKKIIVMTKHPRCAHLSSNHDGPGGPWLVGLLLDSWLKNIYLTVILCGFSEKQPVKEQTTHGCRVWWCAGSWVAVACTRGSSSPGRQTWSWDWSSPCSALQDGQQTSSCSPESSEIIQRNKRQTTRKTQTFIFLQPFEVLTCLTLATSRMKASSSTNSRSCFSWSRSRM